MRRQLAHVLQHLHEWDCSLGRVWHEAPVLDPRGQFYVELWSLFGWSIHPSRCQTPTPIGQSLTLIRCRMASASRTAAMYFAWNVIFLCAGKARTAHWTCYGCNWGISKFIFEHPLTGEVVKMLNKIRISISIYNRQLFLEPGMGASEGEEFHSDLENPLAVSVNRVLF